MSLAAAALMNTSLVPGPPVGDSYAAAEGAATAPSAFASLAFDMFDGSDVWAANGLGIWRTDDNGNHWHEILPANLVGDDPAVRLTGFGWSGSQHLWFSASEAGDVTKQGLRGFAIERSADGGRTWRWTALPSCAGCSMSFSFVNPTHGFALGSNGNLYSTFDGGASWSLVPTLLPRSDVPALDFVSSELGWSSSGRLLERTTDGGRTWERVVLPGPTPVAHPRVPPLAPFRSTSGGSGSGRQGVGGWRTTSPTPARRTPRQPSSTPSSRLPGPPPPVLQL